MSRWPMVALNALNVITKGISPTLKTLPGKFPLVVTAEFRRSAADWQIEGPSVCVPLISSTGHGDASLARVHYQEGKFALANLLVALTPKDSARLSAKYLYWLLMAQKNQLLVPLMAGSANVSLKESDVAGLKIPLPPLAEQQAIVTRLDALAEKSERLTAHWQAITDDAAALLAVRFAHLIADAPQRPLGKVAPLLRRPVALDESSRYREIGARSFGKGLFIKPDFDAEAATWQKPVWVKSGDLVLSNIKAWEGAIAVASKEHDDAIASHRYLTCVPDTAQATAAFLCYFLLTPKGLEAIGHASPGTADRNRTTSPKGLQAIPVPLPPLAQQKAFNQLQTKVAALLTEQAAQREQLEQLRKQVLEQAFDGNGRP